MLTNEEIDLIAERIAARLSGPAAIKPRLMGIGEAARYLGRTVDAMRYLARQRTIPTIRGDGRVQFDIRDLDAWIERNRQ